MRPRQEQQARGRLEKCRGWRGSSVHCPEARSSGGLCRSGAWGRCLQLALPAQPWGRGASAVAHTLQLYKGPAVWSWRHARNGRQLAARPRQTDSTMHSNLANVSRVPPSGLCLLSRARVAEDTGCKDIYNNVENHMPAQAATVQSSGRSPVAVAHLVTVIFTLRWRAHPSACIQQG